MAEKYSLSRVTVTIKNDTFKTLTLSGGSNRDSIEVRRSNELFTKEDSADGPSVFSHNASKAGEIDIVIKQTSKLIADLVSFANFCQSNPELAESTIEIKDTFGVINVRAEGLFPSNLADNSVGQTAGNRTFSFMCEKLDMQEG